MLNGFKFPVLALATMLCGQAPALSQTDEVCEVKVYGSVPENIPLDNIYLRTYNKQNLIKQRQFSFCFDKQALQVNGTFIPNTKVSLSYKVDGIPKGIYSASLFVQTKEIELNEISGMATNACNSRCNYYLYQKMLASEEVANAAKIYPKKRALLDADDWNAIVKLNSEQSDELDKVYRKTAGVKSIYVEKNPLDSPGPYSGARWKFIQKNSTKLTFFKQNSGKSIRNAQFDAKQLEAFAKANTKEFDGLHKTGKRSWEEQVDVINQLVSKLNNDATEISTAVASILEQTRDETEQYYAAYLSNKNKTPFPRLNDAEQSFELLLANWSMSAYLSHSDKTSFSTLFTERFKANEVVNMDKATDAALSQLMYMPAYFAMMDITKGYENIQRAYSGLLPDSNDEYQFSDALHSVNFKYEKGAWRLDKVSQVAINHYEQ